MVQGLVQTACGIWGQRGLIRVSGRCLGTNTAEIPKKEVSTRCQILIPVSNSVMSFRVICFSLCSYPHKAINGSQTEIPNWRILTASTEDSALSLPPLNSQQCSEGSFHCTSIVLGQPCIPLHPRLPLPVPALPPQ